MRIASTSALALILALTGASASEGEGTFNLRVKARGFDEHCIRLEAGEAIRYRFGASVPVDFNIHYHRGKEVLYPVRSRAASSADGVFKAEHGDTFCLMWESPSDAAIDGSVERLRR